MKKCVNETFAVCTPTTRIMINIFDDGSTEKQYEQYLIKDKVIRMINHGNRDKQGSRYTTDRIIHLSDIGWKKWNDEYEAYAHSKTKEQLQAEHLLHLAECEESRRSNGEYKRVSDTFKQNNIRRIKHYIDLVTETGKLMPEYKIFIASMEKSLAMMNG